MIEQVRAPGWFRIVAVLLVVWGLVGFGGFVADRMTSPATLAAMSEYDRHLYAIRPGWAVWAYGIATATGLVGAVLLVMRRAAARPIYAVSLVGIVVLFGWALGMTDLIAVKGFAVAAGLPIVIFVIGVFALWLSHHAIRRGWIG